MLTDSPASISVCVCVCVSVCVCYQLNVLLTVDNPSCVPAKLRALIFEESTKGFSPEDAILIQETLDIEDEDVGQVQEAEDAFESTEKKEPV